ncbi:endolytic transglycosylase MltG [Chromohalobacter sarecensis]|uniref:Endolytic murein transglycosylase n=1 Tax=Chromohalobacter sarecensis TaxID=245294 RepID=A0ABV9D471_9GAMM|nr:endolytic transglycosylase MltG [Chromohalobacter sarecensis]MCK0714357.1 endolytic transglycosylase MltG [Chromohalobacter sarecensis]
MRVVKVFIGIAVLACVVFLGAYQYWQSRLAAPLALDETTIYEVPRGAGFTRVVLDLEARGIIDAAWPYRVLAQLSPDKVNGLRSGEFELDPGMSGNEMVARLSSDNVVSYRFTIPEGWTFAQMRRQLDAAAKLEHRTRDMSDDEVMTALGHEDEHPEGRFFPDTYRYHKGMTDLEVLRRAYERMATTLEDVWAQRRDDLPIDSAYDALILASLIERETGVPEERRQIAGVFTRRLELGMRLQTDPTVIYGMGEDYDGNITRADLRRETPYNTYVIDGLPPTPIAMPGAGSLQAAVDPAPGDALYFVAQGDGSHHFSSTLAEHNAAVRRYILNR